MASHPQASTLGITWEIIMKANLETSHRLASKNPHFHKSTRFKDIKVREIEYKIPMPRTKVITLKIIFLVF